MSAKSRGVRYWVKRDRQRCDGAVTFKKILRGSGSGSPTGRVSDAFQEALRLLAEGAGDFDGHTGDAVGAALRTDVEVLTVGRERWPGDL
jgi:hypothetical protein